MTEGTEARDHTEERSNGGNGLLVLMRVSGILCVGHRMRRADAPSPQTEAHLGYPPGAGKPDTTTNHRNGTSGQTVLTDDGALTLDVPRDVR